MKIITISCLVVVLLIASTTAEPLGLLGNLLGSVTNLVTTTVNTVISLLTSLIFTLDVLTPTQTSTSSVEIASSAGVQLTQTQLNITASVLVQFQAKINSLANVDPTSDEVVSLNTTIIQLVAKLKFDLQATGLSATNAGKIGLGVQTYLFNFLSTFLNKLNEQFGVVTNLLSSVNVINTISVSTAIVTDVLSIVSGKFENHIAFLLNKIVDHANVVISINGDLSVGLNSDQLASLNASVNTAVENSATAITTILFDVSNIPQDLINRITMIYSKGIFKLLGRTVCVALRVVRNLITTVVSIVNSLLTAITSTLLGQVRDTVTIVVRPLLANVTNNVSEMLLSDRDVLIAKLKDVIENINDVDDFLSAFKKLWKDHCYKTRLNILRIVYDQLTKHITIIRPSLLDLISVDVVGTLDGEISNVVGNVSLLLDSTLSGVFVQLTGDLSVEIGSVVNTQTLESISAQVTGELINLESNIELAVNSIAVNNQQSTQELDSVKEKLITIFKVEIAAVKDQIDHSQSPDDLVTAGVILNVIYSGLKNSTEEIDSNDDTLRIRYISFTLRTIQIRALKLISNPTSKLYNLLSVLFENVISKANIEAQAAISLLNVANGKSVNDVVLKVITNAVATLNVGIANIKATGSLTLVQQQIFTTASSQVLLLAQAELRTRPIISIVANLLNTVVNVVKTTITSNSKVYSLDVLNPNQIVGAVKEIVKTVGRVATDVEARLIANVIVDVQAKVNIVIANGDVSATVTANLATVIASSKSLITQTLQTIGNTILEAQNFANAVTTYVQNLVNSIVNRIKTDQENCVAEQANDYVQESINVIEGVSIQIHTELINQQTKDINTTLSQALLDIKSDLKAISVVAGTIDSVIKPVGKVLDTLIQNVTDIIINDNGAAELLQVVPKWCGDSAGDMVKVGISSYTKAIRRISSIISKIINSNDISSNFVLKISSDINLAVGNATANVAATIFDIVNEDAVNFAAYYAYLVSVAIDTDDLAWKLKGLLNIGYYNLKRHVLNGFKKIFKDQVNTIRDLVTSLIPSRLLLEIDTSIDIAEGEFTKEINLQILQTLKADFNGTIEKILSVVPSASDDFSLSEAISDRVQTVLDSVDQIVYQAKVPTSSVKIVTDIIKRNIKARGSFLIENTATGISPNTPLKQALLVNQIDLDAQLEVQPNLSDSIRQFQYVQYILNELRIKVVGRLNFNGVTLSQSEMEALNTLINTNIQLTNENCTNAIINANVEIQENVNLFVYLELQNTIKRIKIDITTNAAFNVNLRMAIKFSLCELNSLAQYDLVREAVLIEWR